MDTQGNIWGWLKLVTNLSLALKSQDVPARTLAVAGVRLSVQSGAACGHEASSSPHTWRLSRAGEWEMCSTSSCLRDQDFPATYTSVQEQESSLTYHAIDLA